MLKDSQTPDPSKCAAIYGAQRIFRPANVYIIFKSGDHFGTIAGVIRIETKLYNE